MTEQDRPPLPTRFPGWPGFALGLIVAGAMAGAGLAGLAPGGIGDLFGGPMAVAHGLAVVAIVTLIGEALRVLAWDRALEACRSADDSRRTGWPIDAIDDARQRLPRRHSSQEQRVEIARTGDLILDRQAWTWRLALIIAFLVPTIGFAGSLWELRLERNTIPYREIALPLLVALAEVLPILLLALGVRALVRSLVKQWNLLAEEVCRVRDPEGAIDVEPGVAFVLQPEPVEARPQAQPTRNAAQRPAPGRADAGGWPAEFDEPPAPPPPPKSEPVRKPQQPEEPRKPRSNQPEDYY